MNLTPLAIVSAHPWQRVAFTTYALSLSFFEAVILDALVRSGSGAQPLVLADVHGVRECLSEQGAHRVGTYYEVEPVAVSGGVFHPKITVLTSAEECHLLVGSGNLTFNGWGGNCEVIEHLHPSFATDAIADAAEFFERLPATSRVRHGMSRHCVEVAAGLRRAIHGRPRQGNVRLLHNLDSPLTAQIAEAAANLGGARRLVAAAPFWDSGTALDNLCRALRVDEAFIHAHAKGCVEGSVGNWPRYARTLVHAVRVASLDTPSEAGRRLHAKVFEILCRRGRLVVSGSANGTTFALGRDGNIEACVLRIQRNHASSWSWAPTERPALLTVTQASAEQELKGAGVLRAELEGDQLKGQVLTPRMSGPVSIFHLTAVGPERLADTELDSEGKFSIATFDLEKGAWRSGGRLVLRVVDAADRAAEGFVSLASFAEITRRGGAVTRRLLAVIFGTESPEDVSAILSWFLEDPQRLSRDRDGLGGGGETQKDSGGNSEQLVPVAALRSEFVIGLPNLRSGGAGDERHWSRFLDQVLAAFREPRGPFGGGAGAPGDDDDDDEPPSKPNGDKPSEPDPAIDKAYAAFNQLFEILTRKDASPRDAEIAFDLTGFMCARLRPDKWRAREWLASVIRAWLSAAVRSERKADVAAAILSVLGTAPDTESARRARSGLLQLGCDLSAASPPSEIVRNYQTVLLQQESFAELWVRVGQIRTYQEQVQAYVGALERGEATPEDYPDLPSAAPDVWSTLERAFKSPQVRNQVLIMEGLQQACPRCHFSLPKYELDKLRRIGIATARNCCGRVVVRREA